MTDRLTRAFAGDLNIRSDGRTVAGIAVPYGVVARVSDGGAPYDEMFEFGAFARTIAERGERVKFLTQHNRAALPIGRATLLREDAAGLYAEFRVSQTQAGDEALELLRDGTLDGLSVGFRPIAQRHERGVTVRTQVRLDEVSAVAFAAYDDARVLAVRSADTPHLLIARQRLALARARVGLTGSE